MTVIFSTCKKKEPKAVNIKAKYSIDSNYIDCLIVKEYETYYEVSNGHTFWKNQLEHIDFETGCAMTNDDGSIVKLEIE